MNISITDIDAILITHEHSDHIKGLNILSSQYNIPVYANNNTWKAIQDCDKSKISNSNKKTFDMLVLFEIGDLKIFPFSIPHDAAEPCGFNIYNGKEKLSVATDLGHVDSNLLKYLEKSSSILLEANYDHEVLKCSSYPYMLKQRISGPNGHLANDITGETICKLINSGLKSALLVHLSKENNFPELAYQTVCEHLIQRNYSPSDISINIAPRDNPSERFVVGADSIS